MAWTNTISTADDSFHPRSDDLWWNESAFVTFRVPDRKLLGIIYYYVRPNQSTVMGGPWLIDPTGDELSTCLHSGWGWNMPLPADADMFDMVLSNGLSVRTLEKLRSHRYTYEAAGCEFDLVFTADRHPHIMKSHHGAINQGLSDFVRDESDGFPTGHFEQSGCMNGWLVVNGERIEVHNAAALRDRSWGPRPLVQSQDKARGALLFGRIDSNNAFQAWVRSAIPWQEDPLIGTTESLTHGWYIRDGVEGDLVSGERRVLERGPDGRPIREVFEGVDEHGRAIRAEGQAVCHLKIHGIYGDIVSFWYLQNWTFDGHSSVPGEVQEWIMARLYSSWRRRSLVPDAKA